MRNSMVVALAPVIVSLAGCDYSADFLFSGNIEGVPSVLEIQGEDSVFVTPVDISSFDDITANTLYLELSPNPIEAGGATLQFVGTGGPVCVVVDPEAAYWNTSIASGGDAFSRQFVYPDNTFDDGDIDMVGGRSVFYTGTPGTRMGDFVVFYEDSLGNEVPVPLADCVPEGNPDFVAAAFHAGRGSAEWCTFDTTEVGVSYTVAMTAWSVPMDDDRLGFGVLVANGPCGPFTGGTPGELFDPSAVGVLDWVRALAPTGGLGPGGADVPFEQLAECAIIGESLRPEDPGPFVGLNEDLVWPTFLEFEQAYCGLDEERNLARYCRDERDRIADAETTCDWNNAEDEERRCFCGNELDLPNPGDL